MAEEEMFVSAIRSIDDRAGVFEHDGDTGYFYLCETKAGKQLKVVAAIRVVIGEPDFGERDVAVQWDVKESKVGLFIRGQLWAAFDAATGAKYGGNYRHDSQANIPAEMVDAFGYSG
ncbi:MAG: DUF2251 domain-containing protein [Phycisphaerae bacterium]|nr:DUF2251 domain-containing protein [Phycisphaerae bacterium]